MLRRGKSLVVCGVGWSGRRHGGQGATAQELARERKEKLLSQFRPVPGLIESKWYINRREWLKTELEREYPGASFTEEEYLNWRDIVQTFFVARLLDTKHRWIGLEPLNGMVERGDFTPDEAKAIESEVEKYRQQLQQMFYSGQDTDTARAFYKLMVFFTETVGKYRVLKQRSQQTDLLRQRLATRRTQINDEEDEEEDEIKEAESAPMIKSKMRPSPEVAVNVPSISEFLNRIVIPPFAAHAPPRRQEGIRQAGTHFYPRKPFVIRRPEWFPNASHAQTFKLTHSRPIFAPKRR